MAMDWALEAAEAIETKLDLYGDITGSVEEIRDIIAAHCPTIDGVAYMPVPRCGTCAHWTRYANDRDGWCAMITYDDGAGHITTRDDFGCVKWKAKP